MINLTVGVDIGGTNSKYGIVDSHGKILQRGSIPTAKDGNVKSYIKSLASEIKSLQSNIKEENTITGIGIGAPNANFYKGTIEDAPNLSFNGTVPFVELMKNEFKEVEKVAITNDANAAAMGEMMYGGAKGMKNFIMITLGTGLGSGFVINGELLYGADGFAGELGHITVVPEGRMCGCGQLGHLENYCSATGMVRTAHELLAHHNASDSLLANKPFSKLTSKDIYQAALDGDEVAQQVFELTADILGQALASAVHIASPEAFFLFGGPIAAGNMIIKPVIESMENSLMNHFRNKVKVLPSKLKMGDAAILGASALVVK